MTRHLPPDVSEEAFSAAIAAFSAIVGEGNVLTEDGDLHRFRDPYPVMGEQAHRASAVVAPGSVEEVQEIVRAANQYGVPLSPISTGMNNSYGGAAPRLSGAVIVDTGKRMNRILEVNEECGYALVEPGVGYFDLYNHLRDNNSKLWIDVPDLGWGSVLGNALERGGGYTPFGDHFGMHSGFEVVLPDGDVIRTGLGAMPNNRAWQLFPYGYGPYLDGIFTQSNFGIVTKMGITLMAAPPDAQTFLITFENVDDIEQIVDAMLPLQLNHVFQNPVTLRNIVLDAAALSERTEWYDGDDPLPDEVIERIKKELDLGYWNLYFTLYGPSEMIAAGAGLIRSTFEQHVPGARFFATADRQDRGGHILHDRHRINTGQPSLDEMRLMDWIPNGGVYDGGHLYFYSS